MSLEPLQRDAELVNELANQLQALHVVLSHTNVHKLEDNNTRWGWRNTAFYFSISVLMLVRERDLQNLEIVLFFLVYGEREEGANSNWKLSFCPLFNWSDFLKSTYIVCVVIF